MKQIIVVRNDLKMRKGKIAAQVAHASILSIANNAQVSDTIYDGKYTMKIRITPETKEWLKSDYKKIVVYVNSDHELLDLKSNCEKRGIPATLVIDNGLTEFNGKKTLTCLAVGPANDKEIDEITCDLPLL